ncbi:MAG: hypothetical protein AAFN93_18120 [Bacteroidota bacterium]
MKSIKNIAKYKHMTGMILGVMTAVIILFTQAFQYDYVADTKVEVKTEKSDESNETSNDLTISTDAVTSVVQININQVLPYIADINFNLEDQTSFETIRVPNPNKLFKALFTLIISPNAP